MRLTPERAARALMVQAVRALWCDSRGLALDRDNRSSLWLAIVDLAEALDMLPEDAWRHQAVAYRELEGDLLREARLPPPLTKAEEREGEP